MKIKHNFPFVERDKIFGEHSYIFEVAHLIILILYAHLHTKNENGNRQIRNWEIPLCKATERTHFLQHLRT